MKASFLLFSLFSTAFAWPGELPVFSEDDSLRDITEEGRQIVLQTAENITGIPGTYDEMIAERLECLSWEYKLQKQGVHATVKDSVFKGMKKNKQTKNFQCISSAAKETLDKLDLVGNQIQNNSQILKEKALVNVMPYDLLMQGFKEYVDELYKTKSEELKKAKNDADKKKILGEASQKIKLLKTVFEQLNTQLERFKFKFFEDYVTYSYNTENYLKNTEREGSKKIQNCIA